MEISKTFTIDSAHRLTGVPSGHKCGRVHGHTFTIDIYVKGDVDPFTGFVIDFSDIAHAFGPLRDQIDHTYLNEIEGLENPTSENLAQWIWVRLKPNLPTLSRIVIKETPNAGCSYEGD